MDFDTYYVDPANDSTRSGTSSAPFGSVDEALAVAKPGDFIRLLPGTYPKIEITKSGEPEKPITIISDASEVSSYAIIDGGWSGDIPAKEDNNYGVVIKAASWIVLENLAFKDCWNKAIVLEGTSHITVRGCEILTAGVAVSASGETHDTLIENTHWKPAGRQLWTDWAWGEIKSGKYRYLAQSTIYGGTHVGGAVIRGNHIEYTFNGLQNMYAVNMEVYDNTFHHIRDNALEPEVYLYNFHAYHNRFDSTDQFVISVDSCEGGLMYFYGNVGRFDRSDPAQTKRVGVIFKFVTTSGRYLDQPLYCFHNSWHDYSVAFRHDRFQKRLHHYNNAYSLINGYQLGGWKDWIANEDIHFDHDCSKNPFPADIIDAEQEANGLENTDPEFRDPSSADYCLKGGNPCVDKGREIAGFTQRFTGKAPDIGAYEGEHLVEGPPFRTLAPPGQQLAYQERPRITRHRIQGSKLELFFSWPLDPETVENRAHLRVDGVASTVTATAVSADNLKVTLTSAEPLEGKQVQLRFHPMPLGENGQPVTHWASTIGTYR